ncbi:hypothetical protein BDV25DRAFT_143385 [Aspergillus avenaceus]|uniref:Apple domain-containing protein n=1 Tax=Aspergillus avenaceus TaxID=36643 RepID=A0A5N6TK78_ASPAV|nr:hypothetical protein BDV25DRAFT_143385 [Aspergillus avenaceus]
MHTVLTLTVLSLAAKATATDTATCLSTSYDACCASGPPVGIAKVNNQQYTYLCNAYISDNSLAQLPAATAHECAELCTAASTCKASFWLESIRTCYLGSQDKYTTGSAASSLALMKTDLELGDDSGDTGDSGSEDNGYDATLDTRTLCPDFDREEFDLPTPNGEKTKWRVYCDHISTRFDFSEEGYLNATGTPYETLFLGRHWDAGYRGVSWKERDFSYRLRTVYNLRSGMARQKLDGFYLKFQEGCGEHVIVKVDDQGVKLL